MEAHRKNPANLLNGCSRAERRTDIYEPALRGQRLFPLARALQAPGSDILLAVAILVIAVGLAGFAILFLFYKRKI